MNDRRLRITASICLVVGAVLGSAGAFVPSAPLRAVLWGADGTALVVAAALLAAHHLRLGNELLAAGFLVFLAGETLIVSGSGMELTASAPTFAAGAALWTASLVLVSLSPLVPVLVRITGAIAAALLGWSAANIFCGAPWTPLSRPFPFVAYPFLAITLVGWAWANARTERA